MFELIEGSYSKAGAREAIAIMGACGPGLSSASFLLRAQGADWTVVREVGHSGSCRRTRVAGGRDVLMCFGRDSRQFAHSAWIGITDVTRAEPTSSLLAFEGVMTLKVGVCGTYEAPFTSGAMEDPELVELSGDGIHDIRVKFAYTSLDKHSVAILRGRVDHAAACKCEEQLTFERARLKPGCECPSLPVPALRPHTLEFIQKAGAFVPTPATRKVLAEIQSDH